MAYRNLLSISDLGNFKDWLQSNEYKIVPTKGTFEVVRAVREKPNRIVIVYKKMNAAEHFSILDKDYDLVRSFLNYKKKFVR